MAALLKEISPFCEDSGHNEWTRWKEELLALLQIKFEWNSRQKKAYLEYAGGHVIRRLLRQLPPLNPPGVGLHVSIAEPDPFEEAIDRLDEYFYPLKDTVSAITEFRRAKQEPGESAKDYYIRLRELILKC